jgi:hypothetical protein
MPYDHIRRYIDSAALGGGVGCVLISTQAAAGAEGAQRDGVVGYAEGTLRAASGSNTLAGGLTQYFSDRRHGRPPAPFDRSNTDLLGVSISADDAARTVTVELIARDWSDARQTLENLRLEDGVLIGDGQGVGHLTPRALYGISLASVTILG